MANTFAIITVIALAVSAFLAWRNHQELGRQVQTLQEERSTLSSIQATYQANIDDRDEAIVNRRRTEEEKVVLQEREAAQQATISDVQTQISTKRGQVETNAAEIDKIREQLDDIGDIRELAGRIRRLQEEIADLEDQKVPFMARRRDLLAEKAGIDRQSQTYDAENTAARSGRSFFDSTRIGAVFPQWGFVTLGIGNSAGVVTGSTLDVIRGGEVIGKLRVRSVESNRSSADIIPDSVAEDVTIRPGDRVVPSGDAADSSQAAN